MELKGDQPQAANKFGQWLKDLTSPIFKLGGYAGTGKTWLLAYLIHNLGKFDFYCCAPTGKAASVLQRKLAEAGLDVKVTTIHHLLYNVKMNPLEIKHQMLSEKFQILESKRKHIESLLLGEIPEDEIQNLKENITRFTAESASLKQELEDTASELAKENTGFDFHADQAFTNKTIIFVDEGSMVDNDIREDLGRTGARLVVIGDPGQLPSVRKGDWFERTPFDHVLQVIQRQALESPIIRLASDIRQGAYNPNQYTSGAARVVNKKMVTHEQWLDADQIITGKNVSRHRLNKWYRNKKGITVDLPIQGEKLICLKNMDEGLFVNGVQFIAEDDAYQAAGNTFLDFNYEGVSFTNKQIDPFACLNTYDPALVQAPYYQRRGLMELDFGYAITCHKAQGSEWPSVLVCDDAMKQNDYDFRKRWLYTAATRAKDELLLVTN